VGFRWSVPIKCAECGCGAHAQQYRRMARSTTGIHSNVRSFSVKGAGAHMNASSVFQDEYVNPTIKIKLSPAGGMVVDFVEHKEIAQRDRAGDALSGSGCTRIFTLTFEPLNQCTPRRLAKD
jgi:hypothetical protein